MSNTVARRGSTPSRHVYDVIVVGGELAGALTSALLARHGLQVLHVEHDDTGAGYESEGWQLPAAPFLMPAPKSVALLEQILTELGLNTELARATKPPTPPLQLIRPGERLDVLGDLAAREIEFRRALGSARGAAELNQLVDESAAASGVADAFFESRPDLSVSSTVGRWKLKRLLLRSPELAADGPMEGHGDHARLFRALAWVGASMAAPPKLTVNRPLGKLLSSPLRVPGGRQGLRAVVANRARELGADVLSSPDTSATIAFEGSKPIGVRLARGDTTFRSAALVAALDVAGLSRIIPEDRRRQLSALPQVEATHAVFTHNLVVPEASIPRGLGEFALVETPQAELGTLLVQLSPARRANAAEPSLEHRVLTVGAAIPLTVRSGGETAVRALIERIWAALDAILPFTRAQALVQSTPWLDVPGVAAQEWEPHALYQVGTSATAGITGLPTDGPWSRLYFAGRAVLPGLGLEGEVLSAFLAVDRIEHALHKGTAQRRRR
jgi:hypothetical protein